MNKVKTYLRSGDYVEVRSKEEILATLDESGTLEFLPFMPEMLKHCGKRYKVFKRIDKTCDTIKDSVNRRMKNTVSLERVRCGGEDHGGCEATCLIFWKESWLKKIPHPNPISFISETLTDPIDVFSDQGTLLQIDEKIRSHACKKIMSEDEEYVEYFCQATEMIKATSKLEWWDYRQYVRDIISGNVCIYDFFRGSIIAIFNLIQKYLGGNTYPFRNKKLLQNNKTPSATINLMEGEFVKIKSKNDILKTLDTNYKNRGLSFDREMIKYCGRTVKVMKRVNKIIDDGTGRMMHLPNDCIILEGVVCVGDLSFRRVFCPRSIYPFWREIWLERI